MIMHFGNSDIGEATGVNNFIGTTTGVDDFVAGDVLERTTESGLGL
jgi:hypothetical protein